MQHTLFDYVIGLGIIALLVGMIVVYHIVFDRHGAGPAAATKKPVDQAKTV